MLPIFADLYSTIRPDSDSQFLKNRWAAIEHVIKTADSAFVIKLVSFIKGSPEKEFEEQLRTKIREKDTTLGEVGVEQEIFVLALACAFAIAKTPERKTEACLLLPLVLGSLSSKKTDKLIGPLVETCRSEMRSLSLRMRKNYPNFKDFDSKLGKKVADAYESPDLTQRFKTIQGGFADMRETINILADESNILWWVIGGRSEIVGQRYVELTPETAAVTGGLELANLISVVPGPASCDAILAETVLKAGAQKQKGEAKGLAGVVTGAPTQVVEMVESNFGKANQGLSQHSKVLFPIHHAISAFKNFGAAAWQKVLKDAGDFKHLEAMSNAELSMQVYLEGIALTRIIEEASNG